MTCKRCRSEKQNVFNGEVAIHFPGRKGLEKPIVWVFPKLVVCLQCGYTEFTVPERELQVLSQRSPVKGAVVLWPRSDARSPNSEKSEEVGFTGE
jgi:hypothetical protein